MQKSNALARSRIYAQLAQGFRRPESDESLQREYDRLFTHRTSLLCSIYEVEYEQNRAMIQGRTLADIGGFYRAFGLEVAVRERPDHLALELEFMSVLAYKEALAIESGRTEEMALCREAQKRFLEAHLGRWAGLFVQSLAQQSQSKFYLNLGEALREFIEAECQALGAQPELIITANCAADPEIKLDCPLVI